MSCSAFEDRKTGGFDTVQCKKLSEIHGISSRFLLAVGRSSKRARAASIMPQHY